MVTDAKRRNRRDAIAVSFETRFIMRSFLLWLGVWGYSEPDDADTSRRGRVAPSVGFSFLQQLPEDHPAFPAIRTHGHFLLRHIDDLGIMALGADHLGRFFSASVGAGCFGHDAVPYVSDGVNFLAIDEVFTIE
jgi:hypothetical protein